MPFCRRLNKRRICQTLSTAFETSQNTMQENILLSKAWHILWKISINLKTVEWWGKKPDRFLYKRVLSSRKLFLFLKTILSCSFPIQLNKATGLQLDGWDLSPFLNMGITLAIFHILGNIPSSKDLFIRIHNGFETDLETPLSILWLIPSSPLALLGLRTSIVCFLFLVQCKLFEIKSYKLLLHFSLSVKAVTLIFISGRDLAISSTHEGKTGNINGKTENFNCLLRVSKYKLDSVKQKYP